MIFDASLKKLRRSLVDLTGFSRGSWFFSPRDKIEELLSPLKVRSKSIFIINNLGQLKKAESFVQRFSKGSNRLIVSTTEKDIEILKIITEQINNKLSSSYRVLSTPTFPNVSSLKEATRFYDVYNHLALNSRVKDVYLMSYAQHYAVFVCLPKKSNIRRSLVEEGVGIYKTEKENPVANINLYLEAISSIILLHHPDLKFKNTYDTYLILLKKKFNA